MRYLLLILLVCAGCARFERPPPFDPPVRPPARDARPVEAVLDTDAVLIVMEDGAGCLGVGGDDFSPVGWTGNLRECPYPYTYAVQLNAGAVSGPTPLQLLPDLRPPASEDEAPFRPIAVVVVTDTVGRRFVFETADGF